MDDRNGNIYLVDDLKKSNEQLLADMMNHFVPMDIPPTEVQMRRIPPRVGRNEQCPCGSGKKFKKCHLVDHHKQMRK